MLDFCFNLICVCCGIVACPHIPSLPNLPANNQTYANVLRFYFATLDVFPKMLHIVLRSPNIPATKTKPIRVGEKINHKPLRCLHFHRRWVNVSGFVLQKRQFVLMSIPLLLRFARVGRISLYTRQPQILILGGIGIFQKHFHISSLCLVSEGEATELWWNWIPNL